MFFAKTIFFMSASMAIGYWVLIKANQEKVSQTIGKIIAWIIIVAAVIGLLCGIANHVGRGFTCGHGYGMHRGMGRGMQGCLKKRSDCYKGAKIKGCFGDKSSPEKAK